MSILHKKIKTTTGFFVFIHRGRILNGFLSRSKFFWYGNKKLSISVNYDTTWKGVMNMNLNNLAHVATPSFSLYCHFSAFRKGSTGDLIRFVQQVGNFLWISFFRPYPALRLILRFRFSLYDPNISKSDWRFPKTHFLATLSSPRID